MEDILNLNTYILTRPNNVDWLFQREEPFVGVIYVVKLVKGQEVVLTGVIGYDHCAFTAL